MRFRLLLLLSACAPVDASVAPGTVLPGDDDDALGDGAHDDALATESCDARVAWVTPEADAEQVPVDATITVGFDAALPEHADWSVVVDGVDGEASLSPDRRTATFVPAVPLAHDRRYEVQARACDDETRAGFRTLGSPVDPDALTGRTWALSLGDLTIVAPSAATTVLPLVGVADVLAHVVDRPDGAHLLLRLALRSGGDVLPVPCAPPVDAGRLQLDGNPRFSTTSSLVELSWQDTLLAAEDFRIDGVVEGGGSRLVSLSFRGLFDVRPIQALTGLADLCGDAAADGQPCEPCADGEVACLPTLASDGSADEVDAGAFDADVPDFLADLFGLCD